MSKSTSDLSSSGIRRYGESLILAIVIALFLRTYVIGAYRIPTSSMMPTLFVGDFVLSWKFSYGIKIPFVEDWLYESLPDRGDIIVFRYKKDHGTRYMKRVIGLPGDQIEIKNKVVLVNNQPAIYRQPLAADSESVYSLMGKMTNAGKFELKIESFGSQSHKVMYRPEESTDFLAAQVVPKNSVFVLGDFRDDSEDSRTLGFVPVKLVEGKAWMTWLSLNLTENGSAPVIRWTRFLHFLN